jgi:hypothetical protein
MFKKAETDLSETVTCFDDVENLGIVSVEDFDNEVVEQSKNSQGIPQHNL